MKEVIEKYCPECKSGNIEKIDYTEEVTGDFWEKMIIWRKLFAFTKIKNSSQKR